jgi:hypothetical protein
VGTADRHALGLGNDSPDKNWITCDNWEASAGYGNCYEEYDTVPTVTGSRCRPPGTAV